MTREYSQQTLNATILQITNDEKPETVDQLARQVHERLPSFSNKEILDAILNLQSEEKLYLAQTRFLPRNISGYMKTSSASWYWITIATTLAALVSVFLIPENAHPIVIVRYTLGAIFILWLPGYAFIKALFPQHLPFSKGLAHTLETSEKNIDTIETIALSFGMSLALVPIVGLLLNYTPWGIRLTPITLSLTALTLIFATAAILREYQSRSAQSGSQTGSAAA